MKVFIEEQRFDQWWFYLLLIASFLITSVMVVKEWELEQGNEPKISLILFILLLIMIHGLVFLLKLKTRIDDKGIYYQFFPFHFSNKVIPWSQIERAYIRKYNPILDYGGWGIRLDFGSKGKAFNVKGNKGLQLELKNGKRILIGTQEESELNRVLHSYKQKFNNED